MLIALANSSRMLFSRIRVRGIEVVYRDIEVVKRGIEVYI